MSESVSSVPPGWYPDPAGTRQWRVWTGEQWSEVTRPYGDVVETRRFIVDLSLIHVMRLVLRAGIVGVVGGFGLLVGVLAHWPGTAHPAPTWFADSGLSVATALLLVGTVVCAFGVRELRGRWTVEAFLPGVNLFIASALVSLRLGRGRSWRVLSEIVLLILFGASLRDNQWIVIGPVLVAYIESSWFGAIVDQLGGPTQGNGGLPS